MCIGCHLKGKLTFLCRNMTQKRHWSKLLFVLIVTFIITFAIFTQIDSDKGFDETNNWNDDIIITKVKVNNSGKGQLYCYKWNNESLQDISEVNPRPDKSIFFHDTSCTSSLKGKLFIGSRQACAVESAARIHPNMDVYLTFSSPGIFKFDGDESDRMLQVLLNYSNVHMFHLDYGNYTKGTPVEELYSNGLIEENDDYAVFHASDILRFLTLWKYGGIYLDTDVVVIKSLENLPPNFLGAQSDLYTAIGVLKFSSTGFGHQMVGNCLNDLKTFFNPYNWRGNGVRIISRVLQNICNISKIAELFSKNCGEFKLYPPKYFYAVHRVLWYMFLHESYTERVLEMTKDSYVIHVWNKLSEKNTVFKKANTAYNYYAKKYCPKVFAEIDNQF